MSAQDGQPAALWLLARRRALGVPRRRAADRFGEVLLSTAVVWEVAIKRSLGKLDAPDGFAASFGVQVARTVCCLTRAA